MSDGNGNGDGNGEAYVRGPAEIAIDRKVAELLYNRVTLSVWEECSRHDRGARYVDGSGISGYDMWECEVWLAVEDQARAEAIQDDGDTWEVEEMLSEFSTSDGVAVGALGDMAERFGCRAELVRRDAVHMAMRPQSHPWLCVIAGGKLMYQNAGLTGWATGATPARAIAGAIVLVLESQNAITLGASPPPASWADRGW